jgi:hypothetical protein
MALELIITDQPFTTEPDTPGAALDVLAWHLGRWAQGAPWDADSHTETSAALELLRRTL